MKLLAVLVIVLTQNINFLYANTFVASFQPMSNKQRYTIDTWAKYLGTMPSIQEFTVCHWERLKYFSLASSNVWSYCITKIEYKTGYGGAKIPRCIQLYHHGDATTANRQVRIYGWLEGTDSTETKITVQNYRHRQWNYICWSYSSITGISIFHVNGEMVLNETVRKGHMIEASAKVLDSSFIIGQEPDIIDGGFSDAQVFMGEITELNMWNETLGTPTIREYSQCEPPSKGNVISWKKENFKFFKADIYEIETQSLCRDEISFVMFPHTLSLVDAKTMCSVHGGKIVTPHSEDENNNIITILSSHKQRCIDNGRELRKGMWLGLEFVETTWYEVDEYSIVGTVNYTNWEHVPYSSTTFCSYMKENGDWAFSGRYLCADMYLCVMCSIPNTPIFTKKGSSDTYMDFNYYIHINGTHQIDFYEGYKISKILQEGNSWIIKHYSVDEFEASISDVAFPVGRREWESLAGRNKTVTLTLSICEFATQFSCNSGKCIDIHDRCNGIVNCQDGSDEEDCELIHIPESYKKVMPPKIENEGKEGNISLPIYTLITILNIGLIDTSNMVVGLTIEAKMRWKDSRLTFVNLNKGVQYNIPVKTIERLWLPLDHAIHLNAIIGQVKQDDITDVVVLAQSNPIPLITSRHREDLRYKGSENYLEMTKRFRIKYDCTFYLAKFPFDQQQCNFTIKMKVADNISFSLLEETPGVIYKGTTSLVGQFEIQKISSATMKTVNESLFTFIIEMKREYKQHVLLTFLPTLLLWLLAYFSLFIQHDDFNDRFMGSVTVLLVFAALLGPIYDGLPETSYLKFIDIWVLWYLMNIFLICIFHIMLDRKFGNQNNLERRDVVNAMAIVIFPLGTLTFSVLYFVFSNH